MQSVEYRGHLLERLFVQGDVVENDIEEAALRTFLLSLSVSEIFAFLQARKSRLLSVTAANIPQFSKYDDMDRAVNVIVNCGLPQISYLELGTYLCAKGTKEGARMKYGENHGKIAEQHGFACFRGRQFAATYLGICYLHWDEATRRRIRARMCLRIPIVQQTLFSAGHGAVYMMDELGKYVSPSTAKRRRSNVHTLFYALRQVADAPVKGFMNRIVW